jgi:addiction module HigA family antidote
MAEAIDARSSTGNNLKLSAYSNNERSKKIMPMKNPPHPGRIVLEEILEPLRLNVTSGAKILGVRRQALNNLVNQRAGISAEMAVRISKAFGASAETWLRMQFSYEFAQARRIVGTIHVRRYRRAIASV